MHYRGMSYTEKILLHKKLAKRANSRLATLEKNGQKQWSYKHAQTYIKNNVHGKNKKPRKRYYTGSQFSSEQDLNKELLELDRFLNFKSSTMRGLDAITVERLETFASHGINVKNTDDFFDFLSSNQFNQLKSSMDSKQIVAIYTEAMENKQTDEQIRQAFQEYQNGHLQGVEDTIKKLKIKSGRNVLLKWKD